MKVFNVRLQAMCTNKGGVYLWAHGSVRSALAGPPMAYFRSFQALQAACDCVGVPCSVLEGPDSSVEWELDAEELRTLGFKLKGKVLKWAAGASAPPEDSAEDLFSGSTPAA